MIIIYQYKSSVVHHLREKIKTNDHIDIIIRVIVAIFHSNYLCRYKSIQDDFFNTKHSLFGKYLFVFIDSLLLEIEHVIKVSDFRILHHSRFIGLGRFLIFRLVRVQHKKCLWISSYDRWKSKRPFGVMNDTRSPCIM